MFGDQLRKRRRTFLRRSTDLVVFFSRFLFWWISGGPQVDLRWISDGPQMDRSVSVSVGVVFRLLPLSSGMEDESPLRLGSKRSVS